VRSGFESFAGTVDAAGLGLAIGAPGKSRALDGDREGKLLAELPNSVMLSRGETKSIRHDFVDPREFPSTALLLS